MYSTKRRAGIRHRYPLKYFPTAVQYSHSANQISGKKAENSKCWILAEYSLNTAKKENIYIKKTANLTRPEI